MPLTLICRRCGSDLHAGDVFCQECGLQQATAACAGIETNPSNGDPAKKFVPAKGAAEGDPAKEFITTESEQKQRSLSKNVQIGRSPSGCFPGSATFQAASSESESVSAAKMAAGLRTGHPCEQAEHGMIGRRVLPEVSQQALGVSAARLHSPLFDATETKNDLGMRGGWMMVSLDTAIVAFTVAFVVALGSFAYATYKKYNLANDNATSTKAIADAQKAAAKRDFTAVYKTLSSMKSSGKQLNSHQQALMDEALYRLGQEKYSSDPKAAVSYLKEISIISDYYVSAQEMIFKYASPVVTNAGGKAEEKAGLRRRKRRAAVVNAVASPAAANSRVEISEQPVLSIPVIPEIEDKIKKDKDTTGAETQEESIPAEPPLPKFSEAEISKYNRLLGAFLSTQSKEKREQENREEPPSFKEWIRQGKPAF